MMADSVTHSMSRKARPQRRAVLAFSLVEVVMVLAIMVTIAAIAVPRYAQAEKRYRLDGAARRIQADIDLARAACRADGQTRTFVFDAAAESYAVTASSGGRLSGDTRYVVLLADAPYGIALDVSGGTGTLAFSVDGYGELHGSGVLALTSGNDRVRLTIGANGTSSSIAIDRSSVTTVAGVPADAGLSAGTASAEVIK